MNDICGPSSYLMFGPLCQIGYSIFENIFCNAEAQSLKQQEEVEQQETPQNTLVSWTNVKCWRLRLNVAQPFIGDYR